MEPKRVLFVCLGNICRSPAAEGVLRHLVEKQGLADQIEIMSCGIGDWYTGDLPDARMRKAASQRGFVLNSRAKTFLPHYLDEFDYILAADNEILEHLHRYAATPELKAKIHLLTAFGKTYRNQIIPDPFYKGEAAFDHILDMLEDACSGLLNAVQKK